jgi:hypothetical protein
VARVRRWVIAHQWVIVVKAVIAVVRAAKAAIAVVKADKVPGRAVSAEAKVETKAVATKVVAEADPADRAMAAAKADLDAVVRTPTIA